MTKASPVMAALLAARLNEVNEVDADISASVTEILGPAPFADQAPAKTFVEWAKAKGLPSRPASPGSVALFVLEHQSLGIEQLLQILQAISSAHQGIGLADPTCNWNVSAALARISNVEPPRSWPKAEKEMFVRLPYALQTYVARRDGERDREVRRNQTEAAKARQQLAALQNITLGKSTDGNSENKDSTSA